MVIGHKNICQNPKCCMGSTKDRYNKKLEAYESRKAYWSTKKLEDKYYQHCKSFIYFCTYYASVFA